MEDPRIEKLSEVVRRDPENLKGWLDLGIVLSTLDRKSESAKAFKRATEINPKTEEAWTRLGEVLAKMGHHDKALDCFLNATKISPDSPHAWNWLAMSYCFNYAPGKGLEAARKAAALSPEYQKTVEWAMKAVESGPSDVLKLIEGIIHRVADETGAAILVNQPEISSDHGKLQVAPLELLGITFKGPSGPEMKKNVIGRLRQSLSEYGWQLRAAE